MRFIRQSPRGGFLSAKRPSGKDQIGRALLPDQRGQRGARHRRIASQRNLRKSPIGFLRRVSHIAHHGQLRASAQARAMDLGNRNLGKLHHGHDQPVEFLEHGLDLVRRVYCHVYSRRKAALATVENDGGNFSTLLHIVQRLQQLVHHLEVDHVQWWVDERDAR
jgi:hypothetical protein